MATTKIARTKVFISYSHKDTQWLKRLQVHLKPLERNVEVEPWDDTQIAPGRKWQEEIRNALASAKIAVLLISAEFLASDFIAVDELPPLLAAAEQDGAVILPVIISPSRFTKIPSLAQFQAVNPPDKPLIGLSKAKQEEYLVQITAAIEDALKTSEESSASPSQATTASLNKATEDAGQTNKGLDSLNSTHRLASSKAIEVPAPKRLGNKRDDSVIGRVPIESLRKPERRELTDRIRSGSREYLSALVSPGGRFQYLDISDTILPETTHSLIDTTVQLAGDAMSFANSVEALQKLNPAHAVLVGEGGAGKTVSLIRFWQDQLANKNSVDPVPIFLPLNDYNHSTPVERERFITTMIGRYYLGKYEITGDEKNALWEDLQHPEVGTGRPRYIFLLDGFNEITVEKRNLLVELLELMTLAKGVQLIITSRYDMRSHFSWEGFHLLMLLPLEDEKIQLYLTNVNLGVLPSVPMEVLRNPMMLTLYTATSEVIQRYQDRAEFHLIDHVRCSADVLHNYIEGQLVKRWHDSLDSNPLLLDYYRLLLTHILPCLAHEMERAGKYSFTHEELRLTMIEALKTYQDDDFKNAFPEFWDYHGSSDSLWHSGTSLSDTLRRIRDDLSIELSLIVEERRSYRFIHQTLRDYLSVRSIINHLLWSLHEDSDRDGKHTWVLRNRVLPLHIRRFLVEILTSADQGVRMQAGMANILPMVFERLRGLNDIGYMVVNVLELVKQQGQMFAGWDFTDVSLEGVTLNGTFLGGNRLVPGACFSRVALNEKNLFPQGHGDRVDKVMYVGNDTQLLSVGEYEDGIKVWDRRSGSCIMSMEEPESADETELGRLSAIGYNGKTLLQARSRSMDQQIEQLLICELDLGTGQLQVRGEIDVDAKRKWFARVAFSPDLKSIAFEAADGSTRLWSFADKRLVATIRGYKYDVNKLAYSQDGTKILVSGCDYRNKFEGELLEFSATSGTLLTKIGPDFNRLFSLSYSPDGLKIVTADQYANDTGRICEWESLTGSLLCEMKGHTNWVCSVGYSPDGQKIVSASKDGTVREWSSGTGTCLKTYRGHLNTVWCAAYSGDGMTIVSGGKDHAIREWDTMTGECLTILRGYSRYPKWARYARDGASIFFDTYASSSEREFTVDEDNRIDDDGYFVVEFDVSSRRALRAYQEFPNKAAETKLPSGVTARTRFRDFSGISVKGHDADDASEWSALDLLICNWAVSRDGMSLMEAAPNGVIRKWCLADQRLEMEYRGHEGEVTSIRYSGDETRLLTAARDGTAREWQVESGTCLRVLQHGNEYIDFALYLRSGNDVLLGSPLAVWSLGTEKLLVTLDTRGEGSSPGWVSPDFRKVVSADSDGIYEREWSTGRVLQSFPFVHGLFVQGCDFREANLSLSEEQLFYLFVYGAKLSPADEDRARAFGLGWDAACAKRRRAAGLGSVDLPFLGLLSDKA